MSIGTRIRYYRMKKKISIEKLAQDITTVPYLTSIENNDHTPPIELLSQICEKLEIPFMTYQNKDLEQLFDEWNQHLLMNDKENSELSFQKIEERITDSTDIFVVLTYNIYLIRYYLLFNELEKALEMMEFLIPLQNDMPDTLKFSYQKYRGNYFYLKGRFIEAEPFFKDAKNYLISVKEHYNLEKADLFYMYGLTLGRLNKNTLCIFHMEEALALFQQSYHMRRCTDCHLLLGVVYRRMQDYKEAEKHYNYAKQLAVSLNYKDIIVKVENNLGYLYAEQGKSDEAISHYLKSFDHSELLIIEDKINTIINIIKEYYKIGFKEQVEKWLNEGLDLLRSNEQFVDAYREQMIELKFYQYIVNDYPSGFESFILEEAIPYFESNNRYQRVVLLAKTLGDYYQQRNEYKSAATSFAIANSAYEKIINF
ncbi:helix-turn-helix transcriptional regulator [Bacillus sp. FJAT-49736]|uniref:helix-turn-helix transcriptional regulator n=1 Tax=Bacillus sp. FJAT-49736 TaxID=2833582 RepID=UPI001BC9F298|nr:helix-turn-helix transcriptional regulator [Bacillus sp. FJAT-49736]MBS4175157.1 helix-turn-helix transcriptional regulator [Bacillus sp. FJAT-49736]